MTLIAQRWFHNQMWRICLDDLALFTKKQRASYVSNGVAWSCEKAQVRQLLVERMGALVDGSWGRISGPLDKCCQCVHFALWVLQQPVVHVKVVLMLLGRLSRLFEFRRPLLGVLNEVWLAGRWSALGRLNNDMMGEVLVASMLMPLAFTDIRANIDGRVTCSDASMTGGGVCVSTGLSGESMLLCAPNVPGINARCVNPWLPLSLRSRVVRMLAISLFDGMLGLWWRSPGYQW